jgi:hypothetical protein
MAQENTGASAILSALPCTPLASIINEDGVGQSKENPVNRMMTRLSCLVGILLLGSIAFAQTEFSAEIVDTQKGDSANAKIYFAKDKMRVEPTQQNPRGGGAFIVNMSTQTSTVIMDQQHMYMELPQQMAAQRNPYAYTFFRTGDVEAACSDWAAQSRNNGGKCTKIGSDTVNGRSTIKYEATNANGDSSFFWIDPKLRFPIKWQGKGSSGELRNIQEGSQPASLFEVPAGYTKMDMGGMMKTH